MLTLTNRLQRCAADTGRCTAAGEKSPPETQTDFISKDTVLDLKP